MSDQKISPEKVNDHLFIIKKTGNMKVPVMIFASEKLLKNIKDDKSLQQGMNVACLPGIYKASMMMPDAHQGYGFSIGGVAAIDFEKGCISPGGIGFDINCLTKNSKILTDHGYFKPIQSFENDFDDVENAHPEYSLKTKKLITSLISFDVNQKSFSSKQAGFFMKKKHSGTILEIETRLGFKLQVTEEHPILTRDGMIESKNLVNHQEIAVLPFKGVEYEEPEDRILVDEDIFSKQEKDELRKRKLLPLTIKNDKLPIITKLFGYLLGDGTIYFSGEKGFVNAYGSKEDLETIKEDFKKLGFSAGIYSRTRDHKIPTRYGNVEFTNTTHELHTSSKALAKLFCELGYPEGNKTASPFNVPGWIHTSPLWIKRLFLSGLFGAELSSPRTHTKTGFDCPTLSMNKNSFLLGNAREFCIQIMELLDEFGVETHRLLQRKDFVNKQGPTHRLRIQISSKEENLLNLWEKIGFSYNKKRNRLSHIAITYIKSKKLITEQRKKIALNTKELKKKGLKLKEVQKLLESPITNERFIERHYYENAKHRLPLDFISFNEYARIREKEISENGCMFDIIASIKRKEYNDYVYDFNIPETHSFVADSIIVSNCGVRLLTTPLTKEQVEPKIKELLESMFRNVPSGVGSESFIRLNDKELDDVLKRGAEWAVEQGYGFKEDLYHCEERGAMKQADPSKVSPRAKARGRKQLGSLGAGNHFLEVQVVDQIFDPKIAEVFGIKKEKQITVMIHCGSRGLGHQVCSDYLRKMEEADPELMKSLPEKDLIYAKAGSQLAKDYFGAMAASANFAWANRHIIAHQVRKSLKEVFGVKPEDVKTVYDVAHNIAKIEEHIIDGEKRKVYLHRKGATRSFPPGHPEIPDDYKEVGQPVIIPGSMGTASYLLVGTETAMEESFGSTAHGAGRVMSRTAAIRQFRGEEIKQELEKKNIYIKSNSWKGICEEAPQVYKKIEDVIQVSADAGLAKPVTRLVPFGVIKG
ncbi:MAG: RtcB family protein [Nanoarchaeota archaeon]|nr:RtcB family protein [Nanoarchaeota archaeon]MBU1321892.1 RtcB family protein [Nanoarchaeota archaeon]MBU1597667.1 RtcB family protein [Nanoarchaeota archaeon]MBU2442230.1 RtcB family protein [Nanoarchaeota archaeon]